MSNNRADQYIAQLLEGIYNAFPLNFVAAFRTPVASLVCEITVHIDLLSIFHQEHLVTEHTIKNRPNYSEIKFLVFTYRDIYTERWSDHYTVTENWPQWLKCKSLDISHRGKWGVFIMKGYQGWILLTGKSLPQIGQSKHQKVCLGNPMDLSHFCGFWAKD